MRIAIPDVNSIDISLTDNIENVSLKMANNICILKQQNLFGFSTVANNISRLRNKEFLSSFTKWPITYHICIYM